MQEKIAMAAQNKSPFSPKPDKTHPSRKNSIPPEAPSPEAPAREGHKKKGEEKAPLRPKDRALLQTLSALPSFLSFSPPSIGTEEIKAVCQTLRSGWLTQGPKCQEFETAFAKSLGAKESLALSSCTAALHLGLRVMGLGPGDGVITSPLTFVSTVHAIMYAGARPFFCDVDSQTGNISPDEVRAFLREECLVPKPGEGPVHQKTGKRIKAILPIHYGGWPADLDSLWDIAMEYGLFMMEDAAHATGSAFKGLPIGHPLLRPKKAKGLLSLTAFSFYATKNITSGEGGLLVSPDPEPLAQARKLSAYGITDARRIWGRYSAKGHYLYQVEDLGFKNNFTDIQASIALAQLRKLPFFLKERAERAAIWDKGLEGLEELITLPGSKDGRLGPSFHLYPLRLKLDKLERDRDTFLEMLRALNIGTSVMFIPVHAFSFYQKALGYPREAFPKAMSFFRSEISLPISPASPKGAVKKAARILRTLLLSSAAH